MGKLKFPLLPLRGMAVLPYTVVSFPVGRQSSLNAVEKAQERDDLIFLVMQKDSQVNEPGLLDLYEIGVVAKVKQVLKLPNSMTHIIAEGLSRGKLNYLLKENDCFYGEISSVKEDDIFEGNIHIDALMSLAMEKQEEYFSINSKSTASEAVISAVSAKTPGKLADVITAGLAIDVYEKQSLLERTEPLARLGEVINILNREIEFIKLKSEIEGKVRKRVEENQKEFYLREQLKVIQEELGDKDGIQALAEKYIKTAEDKNMPETVKDVVKREAEKLSKMSVTAPESNVVRNYVEYILELPWTEESREIHNISKAEKILDSEHYGLKDVKERITEYLAVRQNTGENFPTIICLSGPPGVGKTSVAKSIAKATGRKYVRMSLGGIKDEAEIRGHRRTYIGAMSGRILNAVKQAGTINPLILLDEVDKLSVSLNGDPASALLEVLDSEQNNNFRDHYLEIPYDLSKVLFICTANDVSRIPGPLRDRMEFINISGYTLDEKVNIALKHLYPKQLKLNGISKRQLKIGEDIMETIINNYTREAGVRGLEREIGRICRKTVKELLEGEIKSVKITEGNIEKYLGRPKVRRLAANESPKVGVVRGLAWTSAGGETLEVEVSAMKGSGRFELTGNMGDVMKESAKAAITYIRSKASEIKLNENFYKETDLHIHIPEGAVPKDGPSAGITMATAIVSALTGVSVRNDVAMTGEITIRGRVLAIGGLKEKILAAKQAGIKTVIIPSENEKDYIDMPDNVKEGMEFIFAKGAEDVFNNAMAGGESIWK
ncbi:endopeptidase La [Anaerotignum faecicola]|nr:endopeptidase La [Anaerotignum faecicola]